MMRQTISLYKLRGSSEKTIRFDKFEKCRDLFCCGVFSLKFFHFLQKIFFLTNSKNEIFFLLQNVLSKFLQNNFLGCGYKIKNMCIHTCTMLAVMTILSDHILANCQTVRIVVLLRVCNFLEPQTELRIRMNFC